MASGLALILATLVAVSGDFHNGLKELADGNPDKAVESLTKVIEAKSSVTDINELALLHRAEAYIKLKKMDLAAGDLKDLISATTNDDRRTAAIALHKSAGGELAKLLPKESPAEALNAMAQALAKEDFKTARQYIGGDIKVMLNTADKVFMAERGGGSMLQEMADQVDEMVVVSTDIDEKTGAATAEIEWDAVFTVGLKVADNRWQLDNLIEFAEERQHKRHGRQGSTSATRTLSMLGKALKMYAMDHNEAFPATLDELGDYVGNTPLTWTDPTTAKVLPFLYRAGLTEASSSDLMHVATPAPQDNNRLVLYLDGSIATVAEKEFAAQALKQEWKLPGLIKKTDVAKDTAKEVQDLIAKLGDADSKVRADARKKLKAIGSDAFPFLKEHTSNPDPEIRSTVKELLGR